MKICMAQINTVVGDITGNTDRVLAICQRPARSWHANGRLPGTDTHRVSA